MNKNELAEKAEAVLSLARKHGAESADCIVARSQSLSASCRLGQVEDIERSEAFDLGLRVLLGQKQANISTTDLSEQALDGLAARCVDMAKAAPEDPYCGLADAGRLAAKWPDLDLLDACKLDAERLTNMALEAETAALETKGIANSLGSSASFGTSGFVLATSTGFSGAYESSSFGISCSVLAGEGTGMERDYEYDHRLHLEDLDAPAVIGRRAAERTVKRLNPRKTSSMSVPVVYEPRAARGLVGHFASAISGAAIARGTSFLKDRMSEKIFANGVEIVDDPHIVRGLNSRPFDGEGLATKKLSLIKDGHLKSWLLDTASARQLGLEPTGHAARGIGGPPMPAPSNLSFQPGGVSPEQLIGDISQGLYVTDLIGMGVNGITGDYSRGASGFWIENGEVTYPVSEITIAGNLNDMFAQLSAADDLSFKYGTNAPTVRIEGMTVAGT